MEYSPIAKLDIVLKILADALTDGEVLNLPHILLKGKDKITFVDVQVILEKLKKDDYVISKPFNELAPAVPFNNTMYSITFEGLIFIQSGGYVKQDEIKNSESIRVAKLENELKENRKWSLYLTILIAVGTLVAAIYYSTEIYKSVHTFFHAHGRYWIWETIPKKQA